MHLGAVAERAPQELLRVAIFDDVAARERIDHDRRADAVAPRIDAREEMPRKSDAARVDAGAPRDLAPDDAQRDRNSETTLDHVGQEAVLRVIVILDVATEAEVAESRA